MLRPHILSLLLMAVIFIGAWQATPGQQPKNLATDQGKDLQAQQKIEDLKKEAADKKWTFNVGHNSATKRPLSSLAATHLPPGMDLPKVASQVNTRGAQWRDADKEASDACAKEKPGVLPGLKVAPRVQPDSYAAKSKFDWRDEKKVTPVRDQLQCGSCWSFAAMGAFECNYLIRNDTALDTSEQQIVSCVKPDGCSGGFAKIAFDYLIKTGVCPETAYPYSGTNEACKTVTSPYKAVSWGFVEKDGGIPTPAEMKKALCEHGPLAVSVHCTAAFQAYNGGVFNEFAVGRTNHAILVVGWDDTKGKNGAWLIRNSWNTNWGEQGYMWIEYGCNSVGNHAAWVEAEVLQKFYKLLTLVADDYKVKQGDEVTVPIRLINTADVKAMNWNVNYDPAVATLEGKPVKGNLDMSAWEANPIEGRLVKMGFTTEPPLNSDGTVAVLRFKAVGAPGTKTELKLEAPVISDHKHVKLPIKLIGGHIEIVKDNKEIPHGSCSGQGKLCIEDVRCALQMSVGLRPKDTKMDMDNDNDVTATDAAIILEKALDIARTGQ